MDIQPFAHERPAEYADRLGQWYADHVSPQQRKDLGQYFTPVPIADFMSGKLTASSDCLRLLDPAAGTGVLAVAACEALASLPNKPARILLVAYEIDGELAAILHGVLQYAKDWLSKREIDLQFSVRANDFVLENAAKLQAGNDIFSWQSNDSESFDAVIANPPYSKIAKTDRRAMATSLLIHGQPNIYALFMAISASLLREKGQLVYITPRSYASGLYFREFRRNFFGQIRPTSVHIFDSRRDPFSRDAVLQENIILCGHRIDQSEDGAADSVQVSSSAGLHDLQQAHSRNIPLNQVLNWGKGDCVLHIPSDNDNEIMGQLVRGWKGNLHQYGLEVSTGPVVAFRAKHFLDLEGQGPETHAPMLWMQHVTGMSISWPIKNLKKEQYFTLKAESLRFLVPAKNYVIMRRFSAKEERRRIVAAPYFRGAFAADYIGIENHLNYIYRLNGELSDLEACGLAGLLSSDVMDRNFRAISGNTQVSATELRNMPLPDHDIIVAIGRKWLESGYALEKIDELVQSVLFNGN